MSLHAFPNLNNWISTGSCGCMRGMSLSLFESARLLFKSIKAIGGGSRFIFHVRLKFKDNLNVRRVFSISLIYVVGPAKNYVKARGGRGSTILLHIVMYFLRGRGVFYQIVT